MSRADFEKSYETTLKLDEVLKKIETFFSKNKIKIINKENNTVKGIQGSQLITRLLGGWFVNPKHFPKELLISISRINNNTKINIKLKETLGFGILDPIFKEKYISYFKLLSSELEDFIKNF